MEYDKHTQVLQKWFSITGQSYQKTYQLPLQKNLGLIFDSTLFFFEQISSLSSSCHYHIRDLRHILHTIDFTTASTTATFLVHSRLDYCNSFYHSLPITQLKYLQQIQKALDRIITCTSKCSDITPALNRFIG